MTPHDEQLYRDLALYAAWSGKNAGEIAKLVQLEERRVRHYLQYGRHLLLNGTKRPRPPGAPHKTTRSRLENLLSNELRSSAYGMDELVRTLVGKLPPPSDPAASVQPDAAAKPARSRRSELIPLPKDVGPVIVVVGSGAAEWVGMGPTSWHSLGAKVLEQAARAWGTDPQLAGARLTGNFYRSLWHTLGMVVGDIGLPPKTEAQARDGIGELLASRELDTQHICAAVWESEPTREGLVKLIREHLLSTRLTDGPSLCSELIAHFVDAGLINHVISANIDDSIDRSFDHELGRQNYDRILPGTSDFPAADGTRPCLVKLHGSLGAPQTLNFTTTTRGQLSREMTALLDRMVWGDTEPAASPKLHIVSLGYGWADGALAKWVHSRSRHVDNLFVVKRGSEPPAALESLKDKCRVISLRELRSGSTSGTPNAAAAISIDQFLWALWMRIQGTRSEDEVENQILKDRVPKIARHLILSCLFSMPAGNSKHAAGHVFRNDHTSEKRLLAELLLHLVKCKGMINTHVLSEDPRLNSVLAETGASGEISAPRFIRDRCNYEGENKPKAILVPSRSPWAVDTYFSSATDLEQLAECFWKELSDHAKDDNQQPIADSNVIECPMTAPDRKIELHKRNVRTFIAEQVQELFNASDVEVRRDDNSRAGWSFTEHKPLIRHSDLWDKVKWLVLGQPWTDLLVITEWSNRHAKMLKALVNARRAKNRRVLVIEPSKYTLEPWQLQDFVLTDRIRANFADPEIHVVQIPWWRHHNHFTLAFADGLPLGATFARRYLKSSVISPAFTEGQSDCVELLIAFLTRLRYAERRYQTDQANHAETMARFRSACVGIARNVSDRLPANKSPSSLRSALHTALEQLERRETSMSEESSPERTVRTSILRTKPGAGTGTPSRTSRTRPRR